MKNYKAVTIAAYDKIAEVYKSQNYQPDFWGEEFKLLLSLMKQEGIKIKESKFLDLGCGTGRDSHLAIEEGMDYVGVDLSKEMLRVARRVAKTGRFFEMDVSRLGFADREFDVVWASAILLHLNSLDLKKALGEIKRVLKPDYLSFISIQSRQKGDEAKFIKESKKGKYVVKRFFALYTEFEFKKILEEAGFSIIKVSSKSEPGDEKKWLCFFIKNDAASSCWN